MGRGGEQKDGMEGEDEGRMGREGQGKGREKEGEGRDDRTPRFQNMDAPMI